MPEITVELAVGDVLIIGNRTVTVIDIEGSEVHFRVDNELPESPETFQAETHSAEQRDPKLKAR